MGESSNPSPSGAVTRRQAAAQAALEGASAGLREIARIGEAVWIRGGAWFSAWWRDLPNLARLFVTLTVLDLLGRWLGVLRPALVLDLRTPMTFITAFLPHDLLILLPALVVIRQADADRSVPLVLRGAILVSLTELFAPTVVGAVGVGSVGLALWAALSIASSVLMATGWITLAGGLSALTREPATPFLASVGNLVAGAIGVASVVGLALVLLSPLDVGSVGLDAAILLASAASFAPLIAWAFLGRAVVLGFNDRGRPELAVRLAASAFGTYAALAGVDAIVGATVIISRAFGANLAITIPVLGAGSIGSWLCTSAFLVAFALGLADTDPPEELRPRPTEPGREAASAEPRVAWTTATTDWSPAAPPDGASALGSPQSPAAKSTSSRKPRSRRAKPPA